MHGLNATEAAQVLQALDNAHRDPSLTATFNEMEDHNVTLDVRIVTAPPSWFEDPSQIGGTRMSVIVNANGSNGPIQSGTTVEIVIVGGRLDAGGYGYGAYAAAPTQTSMRLDLLSPETPTTVWSMPADAPSRYEGVLSYTSYSIADGVDYAALSEKVFSAQETLYVSHGMAAMPGYGAPVSLDGCCLV